MKFPGFIGATYTGQSISVDGERCVNLYPEVVQSGQGKSGNVYLAGTPGLKIFAALPDGPVRAIYETPDGRTLAIGGGTLYEIVARDLPEGTPELPLGPRLRNRILVLSGLTILDTYTADQWAAEYTTLTGHAAPAPETYGFGDGLFYARLAQVTLDQWWQLFTAEGWYNFLGYVERSDEPASMCSNGAQTFIVSNGRSYVLQKNALTEVHGVAAAKMAVFTDGYIVALNAESRRIQISKLYDGTDWDALDFAYAEGAPENIVSMLADHRELWLFGEKRTEVFWDSGDPDFPFQRINGAYLESGCSDPWSPEKLDNAIMWRGGDKNGGGMVWRAQGWSPARVSNHSVEWRTKGYQGGISYAYQEGGHTFYCVYFPGRTETWVYDVATGLWHERAWWDTVHGRYEAHRGRCHAYIGKRHLAGDRVTGAIYVQDPEYRDDAGAPLRWLRSSPDLSNEMKWTFYNAMHLDMQMGVGLEDGQGIDPQVALRISNDGGFTWGDERWASIGKIGRYRWRARWNRLGKSRDRCFEASGSDPVQTVLIDAYLDAEAGNGA